MKQFIKSMILGGALIAASVSHAAIVTINVFDDAPTAEGLFLSTLANFITEDFESAAYAINAQTGNANPQLNWEGSATSFNTKVGVFTLPAGSAGFGAADELPNELKIESKATGEHGREVATGRWLDSNDAKKVEWDISLSGGKSFNSIGFYLLDANDQGAELVLTLSNGLVQTYTLTGHLGNANQKYVTIVSDVAVASAKLTFDNGPIRNDGWGIDKITVGSTVPEPGTLLLMGLGLLGLGAARRRTAA